MNEEKNLNDEMGNPTLDVEDNKSISFLESPFENKIFGEEMYGRTKPKKNLIILAIISFLLIAVIISAYLLIFNKPKNVFLLAINNEYKNIIKMFDNDWYIGYDEDAILSESTVDYDIVLSELVQSKIQEGEANGIIGLINNINGLNYKISSSIDYKNKEFVSQITLNEDKTTALDLNVYIQQKKMYLELKNLFDKIIELPEFDYDMIFQEGLIYSEDIEYVLKQIKNSFLKNLNDEDFTSSNAELEIDGKVEKIKKVTYTITSENGMVLIENILTELKENEKFLEALVRLSGQERVVIKNSINSILDTLKQNESNIEQDSEYVLLSVYTKGLMNKAVAYEILDKTEYSEEIIRIVKGDSIKLLVIFDGEEVFDMLVEFPDEKLIKVTSTQEDLEFTINIEYSNKECDIYYTFQSYGTKVYGKINFENEEVTKNKVYNTNLNFELNLDIEGIEQFMKLHIDTHSKTELGKTLGVPEVSNKVLLEEMTESDFEQILTNLLKNEFFQKYLLFNSNDDYIDMY